MASPVVRVQSEGVDEEEGGSSPGFRGESHILRYDHLLHGHHVGAQRS